MNYEQKYKEALEKLQEALVLKDGRKIFGLTRGCLENIFPELKESEDEWIKDDIKDVIQAAIIPKESKREMLAWLEKQCEKNINHTDIKEKAHQIAWEASKDYDPLLSKESWCEMAALDMASWLEKQGEKKNTRKREIDDAYLQGICDAKHEIEKQGKKLDPDEVIGWLKNTIKAKAENYGVYKETRLTLPYNSIEDLINDFKEDFEL